MYKTTLTISGVMCIVLALWSFSNAAEGIEGIKVIGFLNINQATVEELQILPGIDETTSKNIVFFRQANGPFSVVDELLKVKGMKADTLELIRPTIRVDGESTLRVVGL